MRVITFCVLSTTRLEFPSTDVFILYVSGLSAIGPPDKQIEELV